MLFDTHAHYDDASFDEDREELLEKIHTDLNVGRIINPGCDLTSTEAAKRLAEKFEFLYFAAGVHPENLEDLPANWLRAVREAAGHPKCVAIGEIGLDYYWDTSTKERQKEVLSAQLELALELDKPVIIHDREAHGDSLDTVLKYPELRGVFHCFSGSAEMAKILLDRGWYLGFDGPVTYKNARKTLEVLEITPLERILIETDSPYMSPVPMRGKRNDSGNLKYICGKIAEIKGVENVEEITYENANRLFL